MKFKLKKIKSDASFREFYRLYKGKRSSIIVTASKEKQKNIVLYSAINKFYRKKGIYAPKSIKKHSHDSILEIEDLGKDTLLQHVKNSKNKLSLYKKCVDLIKEAKENNLPITSEVTPHHILENNENLDTTNGLFKMYPPIRTEEDRLSFTRRTPPLVARWISLSRGCNATSG